MEFADAGVGGARGISHINYGGHLDNALLLAVVSEARVRVFTSLGYTELDVEGVGLVMVDAAVQYTSDAFHGETVVVEMSPANVHARGFDLVYRTTDIAETSRMMHNCLSPDAARRR